MAKSLCVLAKMIGATIEEVRDLSFKDLANLVRCKGYEYERMKIACVTR